MSLTAASKKKKGKEIVPENVREFEPLGLENGDDNEDVDYEPNEEDSDAENSEAEEMRKYATRFKRELKAKRLGVPVEKEAYVVIQEDANILDDGVRSSEEGDWSYEVMVEDVKHVFQRFYVYFEACKRGYAAGCRNVIGLD